MFNPAELCGCTSAFAISGQEKGRLTLGAHAADKLARVYTVTVAHEAAELLAQADDDLWHAGRDEAALNQCP